MSSNEHYSIGLVAKMLDLPSHTIRFWTQTFNHIEVIKINGRRYYDDKAVNELKKIKELLHSKGMKIEGIKQLLRYNKIDATKMEGAFVSTCVSDIEQAIETIDRAIEELAD